MSMTNKGNSSKSNKPLCIYHRTLHTLGMGGPDSAAFLLLLTSTALEGIGFSSPFVCLFFRTISQKPLQLGLSNCHINVPRWVLETHLFWDQKIKVGWMEFNGGASSKQKTVSVWVIALLWVLASSRCQWFPRRSSQPISWLSTESCQCDQYIM